MSSKAVPDDVEVAGLGLVLLHQDEDQVSHLQTNQARVCCRLTERKTVSLVHFLHLHLLYNEEEGAELITWIESSEGVLLKQLKHSAEKLNRRPWHKAGSIKEV